MIFKILTEIKFYFSLFEAFFETRLEFNLTIFSILLWSNASGIWCSGESYWRIFYEIGSLHLSNFVRNVPPPKIPAQTTPLFLKMFILGCTCISEDKLVPSLSYHVDYSKIFTYLQNTSTSNRFWPFFLTFILHPDK